jgi:hypothetical protein
LNGRNTVEVPASLMVIATLGIHRERKSALRESVMFAESRWVRY